MNLIISMATRGRPEQVVDTIKRSVINWTDPDTLMQVQLDDDDPASHEALVKMQVKFHERVLLNVQPREDTIADKWNRSLAIKADVYLVVGDDDPYVTPGYDTKIVEAAKRFPDGIGMVYGAMANLSFSGSVAPTAGLCKKMGYIQPPLFPYWFVDHWTDDLARMIGRISYADIRTDQSKVGKTQEMREPGWWATFFDACYLMRRRQARAIIDGDDFAGEPWHKELLRTHHPLIEQRSRGVNENVRQQSKQLEGWSGLSEADARYQRVKQKALDMIPGLLADPEMPENERMWFGNALTPPSTIQNLQRGFT
jgi:hypothetical protein